MKGYRVELPVFNGPLDLLLHLIEREELEFLPTAVYEERTGRQLSDELPQELSPYEAPAGTPPPS